MAHTAASVGKEELKKILEGAPERSRPWRRFLEDKMGAKTLGQFVSIARNSLKNSDGAKAWAALALT